MLSSDSNETDDNVDMSDGNNSDQNNKRHIFELNIPYESYYKMKPVTVEYGINKKKYTVLKQ